MKKVTGMLLALFVALGVNVSAAKSGYFPTHTETNITTSQKTKRVNLVLNNRENIEEVTYAFITASAIDENSDFYIYTMYGNLEPIKIEHNSETIDNIMKNYVKQDTMEREEKAYQTALYDLANDSNYSEKQLVVLFGNDAYMDMFKEFITIRSWYPDIPVTVYSEYTYLSEWNNFNGSKIREMSSDSIIKRYISLNGYSEIPYGYYHYDKREGTVTIEQGKADANILAYAYSKKSDLLYISGYMAPNSIYEENKEAKNIKGVSLGYNFVNIEKNASPKNVAWATFSIDEDLYDVNETSFIIPVKNAENVTLYYKSEMGRGVCSNSAKYQRSQDDKIKNLDAPQEVIEDNTSENKTKIDSLIDRIEKEGTANSFKKDTESKFVSVLKLILNFILKLILSIIALAWRLFKIALFILIVLMIVNKNVRKNITLRVMNSKVGPYIEKIIFKLRILWANITKTDPPIKGADNNDKDFVFISHSSKDRLIPNNRIVTVVKELEKRNIKCWISNKNIKTGQNYSSALAKAIENCSIFMVFLSDASAQSKEVGREMTLATSNGKEIIPVQIEDIDLMGKYSEWKYWLSTSQIKFLFNNNKKGIDELADEVEGIYRRYVPDYNKVYTEN